MSTRFGTAVNLDSLTRSLRYPIDLASIADIGCVVVHTHNGSSWLRLKVNDKIKNLIFTNLPWGLRDGRRTRNKRMDLVNEILTISEVQDEVDLVDCLAQRGFLVPAGTESVPWQINAHSKSGSQYSLTSRSPRGSRPLQMPFPFQLKASEDHSCFIAISPRYPLHIQNSFPVKPTHPFEHPTSGHTASNSTSSR